MKCSDGIKLQEERDVEQRFFCSFIELLLLEPEYPQLLTYHGCNHKQTWNEMKPVTRFKSDLNVRFALHNLILQCHLKGM